MKSASAELSLTPPASVPSPVAPGRDQSENATVLPILVALSASHFINDLLQSLISALYPHFKDQFSLSFTKIGLLTLIFQMTASIFQPFVGMLTDRRPFAWALPVGMALSLTGISLVALSGSFMMLVFAVSLLGLGSSVFHPEASRMAYLAAGKRRGLAQSLFQLGGNGGTSLGPLLATKITAQISLLWFIAPALIGISVLAAVGRWYKAGVRNGHTHRVKARTRQESTPLPFHTVLVAMSILVALIFSKYFYIASISSYYTFYLMERFQLSIEAAQFKLFIFAFFVAAGTFLGGPLGDRVGRKFVIWLSILGVAPFSLLLPHANLFWTTVLSAVIGVILSSAFSAILVYAQELLPGKEGLVSGLFFGLAFGMGGIGSAILGKLADATSIITVFQICAFLPLIGLLAGFLPNRHKAAR